jgi:hypothetical protein
MSLEKIEQQLEKLADNLNRINVELGVYNEQLKLHIKRTQLLEERLEPVVKHVNNVQFVASVAGWVFGALIAIGTLISRFL